MAATTFHGEAELLIDADSAFVEVPDVQLHLARSRTFSPLRSSRDQETISPKSLMSHTIGAHLTRIASSTALSAEPTPRAGLYRTGGVQS